MGRRPSPTFDSSTTRPAATSTEPLGCRTPLRALLDRATSSGLLADPIGIYQLLDAVSRSVSVDDTLSNNDLRGLGLEMRSLRSSNVQFVIAPVNRVGRQGARSVSQLDDARGAELWEALRNDAIGAYVQRHPSDTLGQVPR
jgi:hypothetical protein